MDDDGGRRVLLDVLNDPHALESFLGFGDPARSPQSSDVSSTADIRQPPAAEVKPVERDNGGTSFTAGTRADGIGRIGGVSLAVVNPLPKSILPTNGVSSTTNVKATSSAVSIVATKLKLSDNDSRMLLNGSRSQPTAPVAPRVAKNRRKSVTRQDSSRDSKSPSLSTVLPPNGTFIGAGNVPVRIVNQPSATVRPVTPTGTQIMMMPSGSPILHLASSTLLTKNTSSPASHRPIQPKPANAYAHVQPTGSKTSEGSSGSRKTASPAPSQRTTSPAAHPQVTPLTSFLHGPQGPRSSSPMMQSAASLAPFLMNQAMMMPPPFFLSQSGGGMQFLLRQQTPGPFLSLAQLPMSSGSGSENVGTPVIIPGSGGAMLLPSNVMGGPSAPGRQTMTSTPNGPPILHLAAGTTVHLQQIHTPNGVVTVAIPSAGGNPVTLSGLGPTMMTPTSASVPISVPSSVSQMHMVQSVKTASTGTSTATALKQLANQVRPSAPIPSSREVVVVPSTTRSEKKLNAADLHSAQAGTPVGCSSESSRGGCALPSSKTSSDDPVIIYPTAKRTKPVAVVGGNSASVQKLKSLDEKKRKAARQRARKSKPTPSKSVAKSPMSVDQVLLAAVQEAGIGDDDFLYFDESCASPSAMASSDNFSRSDPADCEIVPCVEEDAPEVRTADTDQGPNGVLKNLHPMLFATPAESLPGNDVYVGEMSSVSTSTCDLPRASATSATTSRSPGSTSPESSALEIVVSPVKTDSESGVLTIVCDSSKLSVSDSSPSKPEGSHLDSAAGSEWRFAEAKPSDIDELCSQLSPIPELSSKGPSCVVIESDTSTASSDAQVGSLKETSVSVVPQTRDDPAPPPPKPKNGVSVRKASHAEEVPTSEDPFDAIMKDSENWGKRSSLKKKKEGRGKTTETPKAIVRPEKRVAPSRRECEEPPPGPAPSMPILFEEEHVAPTRPICPASPVIEPSPPKIQRLSDEVVEEPGKVESSVEKGVDMPEEPSKDTSSESVAIEKPPSPEEPVILDVRPEDPFKLPAFSPVSSVDGTTSPEPMSLSIEPAPVLPVLPSPEPVPDVEIGEKTTDPLLDVSQVPSKNEEPSSEEVVLYEVREDETLTPCCSVDRSAWYPPGDEHATLEDCLRQDQDFVLDPLSRFRNPLADGTMECPHPALRPFASVDEACASLKSYHVYYEEPDVDAEEEFDRSFEERCQSLVVKIDGMKARFQTQLLKESMNVAPMAELVMLGRLFVSDERSALKQDKETSANGGGRVTPFSPESFNLDINFSRPSSSASLSQISPQFLYPPTSDASRFCSDIDFRRESESRSSGRFSPPAIEIPGEFSDRKPESKEESLSSCVTPRENSVNDKEDLSSRDGSVVGQPTEEPPLEKETEELSSEVPPEEIPRIDENDSSGDELPRYSNPSPKREAKKKRKDKKKKHKHEKKKKKKTRQSGDEADVSAPEIVELDSSSKDQKKKAKKDKKHREGEEDPSSFPEIHDSDGSSKELKKKSKKEKKRLKEESDEELDLVSSDQYENHPCSKEIKKRQKKEKKRRKAEKRRMKAVLNEKPGSPFPWLKSPRRKEIDMEKLLPALEEHRVPDFDLDESKTSEESWNLMKDFYAAASSATDLKSHLDDPVGRPGMKSEDSRKEIIDLCGDSPEPQYCSRDHHPESPVSSCSSNSLNQSSVRSEGFSKPSGVRKRKESVDLCDDEPMGGQSLTFKIVRNASKDKSLCYSFRKPDKRLSRQKAD